MDVWLSAFFFKFICSAAKKEKEKKIESGRKKKFLWDGKADFCLIVCFYKLWSMYSTYIHTPKASPSCDWKRDWERRGEWNSFSRFPTQFFSFFRFSPKIYIYIYIYLPAICFCLEKRSLESDKRKRKERISKRCSCWEGWRLKRKGSNG